MAIQQVAALAARIFGVYWVLNTAQFAFFGFLSLLDDFSGSSILWLALPLALVAPGPILFLCANRIAQKLIPKHDSEVVKLEWSLNDSQSLAFACVGLFVVLNAIPALYQISLTRQYTATLGIDQLILMPRYRPMWGTALQVISGGALIFMPYKVSRLIQWLRSFVDTKQEPQLQA